MLSYRHAFHAGNHADVLKHIVLVELLRYLTSKDKPLVYIDTHAGAGMYRLDLPPAATQGEFRDGIERLWSAEQLPEGARRYVDLVRQFNPGGELRRYPGSPRIASELLRPGDPLWLSELHPSDHAALENEFAGASQQVHIVTQDGFATLRSLLPPNPRRALVMIDPSYELATDYSQLVAAIGDAQRRFAGGVYAVWYPLLPSRDAERLPGKLRKIAGERWLDVRMAIQGRNRAAVGLYGSGMFIVNPPYTLPALIEDTLPRLVAILARDKSADFELQYQIP